MSLLQCTIHNSIMFLLAIAKTVIFTVSQFELSPNSSDITIYRFILTSSVSDCIPYFLIYLICAIGITLIMIGLSYVVAEQKPDIEKTSGYECGFDPFSDARDPFHIRFYLLSILFIIFDIEIVFFFPWAVSLRETLLFGFYSMTIFIVILSIGFYYEWRKNALEWD
uniref:NADH-ubiquinone oxidoreductase chain 3 n=1 Tax=Eukaryota sp. BB2 TaxID=1949062 RepID=A0A1X8VEY2_9EUKA|nr:NADH dehydrogenase subunit 3 [Eukaryota sp. BB2]AQL10470.1 NADH dehydrogenase subunit 3 [Eukaryota sp. BB2]